MIRYCLLILFVLSTSFGFAQTNNPWDLMPMPKEIKSKNGKFRLERSFTIQLKGRADRLNPQATRFLRRLDERTGLFFEQQFIQANQPLPNASLQIKARKHGTLKVGVDESYQLFVSSKEIQLIATTDIGALRGLETLLQLLQVDQQGYYFPAVEIKDAPRFPWRGLMIDPARHFIPVEAIYRNLNAMAVAKLNVLHLHLSDNQGFRIESKVLPQLHKNGSDGQFYTQEQIKGIIAYANELGIRVMPEFDVPGHATAMLMSFPEIGSAPNKEYVYKMEVNAGVFDPTLDPTNEKTYEILTKLFTEMAALFPDEYFHIGGDENEGHHWKENVNIQEFMKKNRLKDKHDLQLYFTTRLSKIIQGLDKKMVGWDEIYTSELPKETLVHGWRNWEGMDMYQAPKEKYTMIVSAGYYIDLLKRAEEHYLNDPLGDEPLMPAVAEKIIGAEATMWSELVTPQTIDSRIWPRTAAIAERFWSPKEYRDVQDMYRRLELFSHNLEADGLQHIHSKEAIMRKLCHSQNVEPLRTLIDVVEPLKGYTRNPEGTLYNSYYSFSKFADAANADAPDARAFRNLVESYYKDPKQKTKAQIIYWLERWKNNHFNLIKIIKISPILNEVLDLSEHLMELSNFALKSFGQQTANDAGWNQQKKLILENARQQGGRTELQIVDAIEQLIQFETQRVL